MTYNDTVNWMFSQLPMYQSKGKSAYKKDLSNTLLLTSHLNNPENKFKSVHVAGTNGKGSTSHMIASILQEAGYKVGLYTSPHLKDYRERIKINGKEISKQYVIGFIKRNMSFFEKHSLSFFEMTVGLAFEYFARKRVDIAVIEVGLGGRLDSTNIITPEVSVITNIGFDHMQFLGNSLEAIAKEKAGIIKENVPIVIGETQKETQQVFQDIAKNKNATIYFADFEINQEIKTDLKGRYQSKNTKTAYRATEELKKKGFNVSETQIKKGFNNVINNTGLLGRWQVLNNCPKVICDTAHNREGLSYVVKQVLDETYIKLHIVLGVVNDKDLNSIIDLLPKNATYYFCRPNIPRGLDEEKLKDFFQKNSRHGKSFSSVKEAYKSAMENSNDDDLIFVGGSTFVVAEII